MIWSDFIADAFYEIGAYAPGDSIDAASMDVALRRLNYRIDEWLALKRYAYNVAFQLYTLPTNTQPITIGPSASSPDWATPNDAPRPVRIEGANLVLSGSNPSTDLIINIRDDAWWLGQQVKGITSTIPTDLYYSPGYPLGELYFWPIPTQANQVRLEIWSGQVQEVTDIFANFAAPPAYTLALMLTLAEDLTTPFSRPMPATLPDRARVARSALQSNNIKSPRCASADYGTGLGGQGSGFNWRSGMPG